MLNTRTFSICGVVAGGIRHTPAEVAAPLHQEKMGRPFRLTHQVNGQQCAGEAWLRQRPCGVPVPLDRLCYSHTISPLCPLCRSFQVVDEVFS